MFILHDKRLPREYKDALSYAFRGVRLLPFDSGRKKREGNAYASIEHHPDIFFFKLDTNTIIHAPLVDETYLSSFTEGGIELIPGSRDPGKSYPDTAGYNAASLGRTLFHNLLYTDPVITENAKNKKFELINVNQGYTRCSSVTVGDSGLISSDKGINTRAKVAGKDVLRISPGSVLLPGESGGFLGGASGVFNDGDVVFLGDLDLHECGQDIRDFIAKHGKKCVELKKLPLLDVGTILMWEG
ncbi:MAG: hypothetical protein P9L90_04815 [Candidatus Aadella gelida]|nr:hypothetical protein [Candidatus Aadella gelida]